MCRSTLRAVNSRARFALLRALLYSACENSGNSRQLDRQDLAKIVPRSRRGRSTSADSCDATRTHSQAASLLSLQESLIAAGAAEDEIYSFIADHNYAAYILPHSIPATPSALKIYQARWQSVGRTISDEQVRCNCMVLMLLYLTANICSIKRINMDNLSSVCTIIFFNYICQLYGT